jgi:hypothetical protein
MVAFKKPGDLPTTVVPAKARPQKVEFWLTAEQRAFLQQAIDLGRRKAGGSISKEEALAMVAQAYVEGGDGTKRTKRTMLFKCDDCAGVFMDAGGERVRVEDAPANDADPAPEGSRAGVELDPAAIVYDERSRHIPLAVQRAVFARHRGCCAVPGCTNRLFLQFHHLDDGAEHRRHDAARITLVCTAHHQSIHEGMLRVRGSVETGLQFVTTRAAPPKPTAWELAASAMQSAGIARHEAKACVLETRREAGDDITVEEALRLAFARVPPSGVREAVERYGPS